MCHKYITSWANVVKKNLVEATKAMIQERGTFRDRIREMRDLP